LVRKSCKECKIELLVLVKGINMMGGIIWQVSILFPLQPALVISIELVEIERVPLGELARSTKSISKVMISLFL
jgi:hypothetical protein